MEILASHRFFMNCDGQQACPVIGSPQDLRCEKHVSSHQRRIRGRLAWLLFVEEVVRSFKRIVRILHDGGRIAHRRVAQVAWF